MTDRDIQYVRAAALVCLAVLLVTSAVAPGTAAAVSADTASAGTAVANQPAEKDRSVVGATAVTQGTFPSRPNTTAVVTGELTPSEPGEVRLTVTYRNVSTTKDLKIALPCASEPCDNHRATQPNLESSPTLQSYAGFKRAPSERWDLVWNANGSSRRTISVTYTVNPNTTFVGSDVRTGTDAGEWAWVHLHTVLPATNYDDIPTVATSTGGLENRGHLVLGNVTVRGRLINGQRIRMVSVPATPVSPAEFDAYFRLLDNFTRDLRIGDRDSTLTVWVTPGDDWHGSSASDNQVVLNPTTFYPKETLAHEYVHTRQSFYSADARRMCDTATRGCASWLLESGAIYYGSLVNFYYGPSGIIYSGISGPTLLNEKEGKYPLDHEDHPSHSHRGARVLLVLDWEIRQATGGNRSIQDVYRRLNEYKRNQGHVTHSVFLRILQQVAGRQFSSFSQTYIEGTEVPDETMTPPRAEVGQSSWLRGGDDHWNTSLSLSATPSQFSGGGATPNNARQATFTLRNTGDDPSVGHAVDVQVPCDWQVRSPSSADGWWNASSGTWHVPELDAGEFTTLTMTLVPSRRDLENTSDVSARATDADGNVANATIQTGTSSVQPLPWTCDITLPPVPETGQINGTGL